MKHNGIVNRADLILLDDGSFFKNRFSRELTKDLIVAAPAMHDFILGIAQDNYDIPDGINASKLLKIINNKGE